MDVTKTVSPDLWIQSDHLDIIKGMSKSAFLSRTSDCKIHPDFKPLYTKESVILLMKQTVTLCRNIALSVGRNPLEALENSTYDSAGSYIEGYQDAAVDIDEELRKLLKEE